LLFSLLGPYVTAVGATQVKPNTSIVADLATGTQPEEACETVIYSGGGFSNVFPIPSYQSSAVHNWFKNFPPPYGADRFNNSQKTRGYPDISANGSVVAIYLDFTLHVQYTDIAYSANYVVAVDGNFSLVFGTSASSPTFGSIVTLINQQRLNVGKGSIGFINPTAYAHPNVFNDITEGGNQGCGTPGFESAPGWDPVVRTLGCFQAMVTRLLTYGYRLVLARRTTRRCWLFGWVFRERAVTMGRFTIAF